MGVTVTDVPGAAGVECPKKTGEMDKFESCTKCQDYATCLAQILGVLGPGA